MTAWLAVDRIHDDDRDDPMRSRRMSGWALGVPMLTLLAAFAVSGSVSSSSGDLGNWYRELPFTFADSVPLDQFLVGVSAGLFLLATGNRIVRLVLEAAGTPLASGESTLRGGRLLGPMERIFEARCPTP